MECNCRGLQVVVPPPTFGSCASSRFSISECQSLPEVDRTSKSIILLDRTNYLASQYSTPQRAAVDSISASSSIDPNPPRSDTYFNLRATPTYNMSNPYSPEPAPDLSRNRLPTLFEVLARRTLAPVDLYFYYIYMRDQQRAVDYLDFWWA